MEFLIPTDKKDERKTFENTTYLNSHKKRQILTIRSSGGDFNIKLIEIDNWEAPSNLLTVENYVLNSEKKQVLYIPNGYVNGFRALKTDSKLMIMSNYNFNEIKDDQIRFDQNKWNEWDK